MLNAGLLALAMLAADPAPSLVQWPWVAPTPVRHYRIRHHRRQRYRLPTGTPDCAKINDTASRLTQNEIEDAIRNKPRQQAVYDQCQTKK